MSLPKCSEEPWQNVKQLTPVGLQPGRSDNGVNERVWTGVSLRRLVQYAATGPGEKFWLAIDVSGDATKYLVSSWQAAMVRIARRVPEAQPALFSPGLCAGAAPHGTSRPVRDTLRDNAEVSATSSPVTKCCGGPRCALRVCGVVASRPRSSFLLT